MTETILDNTELIELPPAKNALQTYTTVGGLNPYLQQVKAEALKLVEGADVSTDKGRKAIAGAARKVASVKIAMDKIGKDESMRQKEIPKLIDAERKRAWDILEALQKQIRQPLTEWEDTEKERIHTHEENIMNIRMLGAGCENLPSPAIAKRIKEIEAIKLGEHWQEYEITAGRVKDEVSTALKEAYEKTKAREEEQAELARLKAQAEIHAAKEREERIAAEAAHNARKQSEKEAAAKAAQLQLEAEQAKRKEQEARRREQEAKAAAKKAKKDAEEKIRKAVEAERLRVEQEKLKEEEQAKKREANLRHRKKIIGEAIHALEEVGIDAQTADDVINLIAAGEVPHVSIAY